MPMLLSGRHYPAQPLCQLKAPDAARQCWYPVDLNGSVHFRTARFVGCAQTRCMLQNSLSVKATAAIAWVSAVSIAAIAWNVNLVGSGTFLAGIAVVPPLVMMLMWNTPRQTMSESIQEVLR
jgi:hypothetical protein